MKRQKQKWKSQIKYRLARPLLGFYLERLRKTGNFTAEHEERLQHLIDQGQPCIPCYWHHQNIACALFLMSRQGPHFTPGFLVSPSHDGDAPAAILHKWGAAAVRGSASRTGAEAMRDLYQLVKQQQASPGITPDGPRGPKLVFKSGPLLLAQMLQIPILPMTGMPEKYWRLNSWDRFVMPKPGTRFNVAIGKPVYVEKGKSLEQLEPARQDLQDELLKLTELVQPHAHP